MSEVANEKTARTIGSIIEGYKLQENSAAVAILREIQNFVEGEK